MYMVALLCSTSSLVLTPCMCSPPRLCSPSSIMLPLDCAPNPCLCLPSFLVLTLLFVLTLLTCAHRLRTFRTPLTLLLELCALMNHVNALFCLLQCTFVSKDFCGR